MASKFLSVLNSLFQEKKYQDLNSGMKTDSSNRLERALKLQMEMNKPVMKELRKRKGLTVRSLTKRLAGDSGFEISKERFSVSAKKILFWTMSESMHRMGSIEGMRDTLLLGSKIAEHIGAMEKEIGDHYKHQVDPILTDLVSLTPAGYSQLMCDIPAMGAAAECHGLMTLSDELFNAAKLCTIAMQRAKELGETDERVVGFKQVVFPLQHSIRSLYPELKL